MIRDKLKETSNLWHYPYLFRLFDFQLYIFYELVCMLFHNEKFLGEVGKCRTVSSYVDKNCFCVFLKNIKGSIK